jgi:hypothetical protein
VKLSVQEDLPSSQAATPQDSRPESFKDDPLIQEAIGLFNAQVIQET